MDENTYREVKLYLEHGERALETARLNLDNGFISASINRSYYAIFYAANALLATIQLPRSKHSGVLAAFRQHFIKTGNLPSELSEIYAQVMEDRHEGDYELITAISQEDAEIDLSLARHFLDTVIEWLRKEMWI